MTRPPGILRGALRACGASLLLGVLLLGAASHFWHHVHDPECGSARERSDHVCVACSGLHASTLVAAGTYAPVPQPHAFEELSHARQAAPLAPERGGVAPRAPPAS